MKKIKMKQIKRMRKKNIKQNSGKKGKSNPT